MLAFACLLLLAALDAPVPAAGVSAVPMAEEPFHRLLFQNPRAAVYDVVLPPGALMRYHRHPTNHLAVVIEAGTLRNEVEGAAPRESFTGSAGTVVYIPAGPPHRQSNVGTAAVHFVAAEMLAPAPPDVRVEAATPRAGCAVTVDTAVVLAWRCRVAPGARLAALDPTVPFLRVALGSGSVAVVDASGAELETTVVPGAVTWHDGGPRADLHNRGSAPLDVVEIAWRPQAKPIPRTADVPKNPGTPPQ